MTQGPTIQTDTVFLTDTLRDTLFIAADSTEVWVRSIPAIPESVLSVSVAVMGTLLSAAIAFASIAAWRTALETSKTARATAAAAAASAKAATASARAEARSAKAGEQIARLTRGTWKLYKLELRKERTSRIRAAVEIRRLATQWSRLAGASDELAREPDHRPSRYTGLLSEVRDLRNETHDLARELGWQLPIQVRADLDQVWHFSRRVFDLEDAITREQPSAPGRRLRARMKERIGQCRLAIWLAAGHMAESLPPEERQEESSYGDAFERAGDAIISELPDGHFDPPPVDDTVSGD